MTDPFERAVLRDELAEKEAFVRRVREGLLIHTVRQFPAQA